jgi:cytoskeletal protein RodZ
MNMQDKELDNLFHSKLDSFEAEPSANVWQNIDAGLSSNKRKRLLVPLLSAAASIIVLIAVGALLITRHMRDVARHPVSQNITKVNTPVKAPVVTSSSQATQIAQVDLVKKTAKQLVILKPVKKHPVIAQTQPNNATESQKTEAVQPAPQVVAAVVPDKHDANIVQPQKVDTNLLVVNNNISKPDVKFVEPSAPVTQTIAKATPKPTKKHHIHSLGDMLNTVIAAVDKRKDKFIEFTDTDDDQSIVTGVNLGIVAVKKQN